MKLKFYVYCPDERKVVDKIISIASKCGAGTYGKYSHVAFITHGEGNWKTKKGARPFLGKVGTVTRAPVAKIEMTCNRKDAKQIEKAIKAVHPWEQVDIEFVRIEV